MADKNIYQAGYNYSGLLNKQWLNNEISISTYAALNRSKSIN